MVAAVFLERLVGERDLLAAFLGDSLADGVARKSIRVPSSDEALVVCAQRFPISVGGCPESKVTVRIAKHGADRRVRVGGVT